ncbi:MAG: hypothetical protein L6Q71_02995 [Planctomycetes bacterium]|nr:hypothetical protein [Planctomycetota bacterium]NUQ35992.1 hypothetical protein [Planctomycetaceae bacterium]
MDILINGERGLVETDEDVTLGQLIEYLRGELLKQRLIARTFAVDGKVLDHLDDSLDILGKSPKDFNTLDVTVASAEAVAHDLMTEFVSRVPMLSKDAVSITESLQSGDTKKGKEKLLTFIEQSLDVVKGLGSVSVLVHYNPADPKLSIHGALEALNGHLKSLSESIADNDYTTAGDILEFDIAPAIGDLQPMMKNLKSEVEKVVAGQGGSA